MTRLKFALLFTLALGLMVAGPVISDTRTLAQDKPAVVVHASFSTIPIAEGTQWETKAYLRDSHKKGPTVMIVGGMHGREVAGFRAARQIKHWPITAGKLLVISDANVTGIAEYSRYMSGLPSGTRDLNRHFPSEKDAEQKSELAKSIWKLVEEHQPDWLIDLHESFDHAANTTKENKYLGNSAIVYPDDRTQELAEAMIAAADETITKDEHQWRLLKWPIEGSLARAAASRLGAKAMILETSRKDMQPRRERNHRESVHILLRKLEMISDDLSIDTFFEPGSTHEDTLRVAIFNDLGARGASSIEKTLDDLEDTVYERICGRALRNDALEQFDVIVAPGGSGTATSRSMGDDGLEKVTAFVREGGGYMGFCAGAYLAPTYYSWSLGILDADVLDTKHWARGKGNIKLSITKSGKELFGTEEDEVTCYYCNGPILGPGGHDDVPDYEVLATFKTEVKKKGVPGGVMVGTPAIVRAPFGKGRVFVSSPHPEADVNAGLREFVRQGALWVAFLDDADADKDEGE